MKTKKRYELIGKKIKEARENAKMSQREFAKIIGFNSTTAISLIESGERRVAVEDLEKLARALNKDIEYFLGYKDRGENEKIDVRIALRADKDLGIKDKKAILRFIELAKERRYGGRKK